MLRKHLIREDQSTSRNRTEDRTVIPRDNCWHSHHHQATRGNTCRSRGKDTQAQINSEEGQVAGQRTHKNRPSICGKAFHLTGCWGDSQVLSCAGGHVRSENAHSRERGCAPSSWAHVCRVDTGSATGSAWAMMQQWGLPRPKFPPPPQDVAVNSLNAR